MAPDLYVSFQVFSKDTKNLLAEPTVNVHPSHHGMCLPDAISRELAIIMEQFPAHLHDYQVRITNTPVDDEHLVTPKLRFIDTVDWSTVSPAGKEKAASHMILPGEWSRADLLETLKNSGSDELDVAQERLSSSDGPLTIAELDLLWHEVSRAADHVETLTPAFEALEARLAKTVIQAWQAYSQQDQQGS